jgi:hypothetical protein
MENRKKYHTGTSQKTARTQHGLTDKLLLALTLLVILYSSPNVAATPRTILQRKQEGDLSHFVLIYGEILPTPFDIKTPKALRPRGPNVADVFWSDDGKHSTRLILQ